MRLIDLIPEIAQNDAELEIAGITADSRAVKPGFLFAALQGVVADGRAFIPQAIEAGAVAVLGADLPDGLGVATIEADEPRLAFAKLAAQFYPGAPETMIAITGTNGKSSTVDFLRQIWTRCGYQAASMGTLGAVGPAGGVDLGHTTPDPVAIHSTLQTLAGQGVTHCAMEASSHGLAQYRLDGVTLNAAAFTNLTQDHLDYHPTFDDYRHASRRLVPIKPL